MKRGDEIYIKFEVSNNLIYLSLSLMILVVLSGLVFAYQTNLPPSQIGHSGEEVLVNVAGSSKNLQVAINDFLASPPSGSNVEFGSPMPFTQFPRVGFSLVSPLPSKFSCNPTWPSTCTYNLGISKNCVVMINKFLGACPDTNYQSDCQYDSSTGLMNKCFKADDCNSVAASYVCY